METTSRCRKRGHPSGWIRTEKRHRIYKRDHYKCLYCNKLIYDALNYTVDHVRARNNGGHNHHTNLVTACRSCNSSLQDKKLKDWCELKGYDYNEVRKRIRNAIRRKLP
jgi:5-methylcytosine-specific restriction endonuclease McrA